MPFTDEKRQATWNNGSLWWQREEVPQHRLRVRGWNASSISEAEYWSWTCFIFQVGKTNKRDFSQINTCAHRWGLMRLTRQRRHNNTSNTAQPSEINRYRSIPTHSLQKRTLTMMRISKHMALLTELFTEVNKTFGTKYIYRNAKWNKNRNFFLFI